MLPPQQTDKNLLPKWWDELKNGKSVVHVTQGTVATDENELILPTIKALANENVIVIVTTNNPDKLKGLPSNIIVDRFIPHSLLLPYVKVMITNGGYNGVKEALANGVPLIVAGESEDKPEVASRVAYSGAGINLKTGNPEPNQLKQAVLEILNNPSYKEKAKMIKKEFIEYDSSNLALSLLEKLANTKKPVY
jgi:MGT family glycosyltransferase